MTIAYSDLSVASAAAKPHRRLFSSIDVGWRTLLLEHHQSLDRSCEYEVLVTTDQTIVMALDEHDLDIKRSGQWRSTVMRAGSFGTRLPNEAHQLRWRARSTSPAFCTAHLYLPWEAVLSTIDRYRLAGQATATHRLSQMSGVDGVVQSVIASLLRAMKEGVDELYAASAREWLVVHLLCASGAVDRERLETDELLEPSDRRLKRSLEALTENPAADLSLEMLANEASMSKFHFLRTFRACFGLTPFQYLTDLRMTTARRLLTTTDMPIGEIGRRCGYDRPSNFTTAFTRFFSITPSEARRASRR